MLHLHVLQLVLRFLQGDVQAADAVAGLAVDALDPPFTHALPNELTDIHLM